MPVSIRKIPDAPILVIHAIQGDDPVREIADTSAEIVRALDAQREPVFLVIEMLTISMALSDIIQAAKTVAHGNSTLLHHHNIRENVYVLTDRFFIMAVQGLSSATFGQIKAQVFDTVDQAVAYCRERLGVAGS